MHFMLFFMAVDSARSVRYYSSLVTAVIIQFLDKLGEQNNFSSALGSGVLVCGDTPVNVVKYS